MFTHLTLFGVQIFVKDVSCSSWSDCLELVQTFAISFGRLLFWLALVVLLLRLPWARYVRKVFFWLGVLSIALFFGLELHLLISQGTYYTHSIASILANSNWSESREFIASTVVWADVRWVLLALGALLLLVVLVLRSLAWLISSCVMSRWIKATLLLLSLGLGIVSQYDLYSKAKGGYMVYTTLSTYDRLLWSSYSVYAEAMKLKHYLSVMKDRAVDINPTKLAGGHNIVLVLGESLRRDYMSCYGFEHCTTPRLDALRDSEDLVLFAAPSSPASSTVISLIHTLSTKQTSDVRPWYEYPFINMLMRKAGYRTAWLSNQESSGFFLQSLNAIAGLSDYTVYTTHRSIDDDTSASGSIYDERLLSLLDADRSGRSPEGKYFDILHLMGSHYTYTARFPPEYSRFKASDLVQPHSQEKRQRIADYMNTVYYNDFVLNEIIQRYASSCTMLIYLSDHGEVLYDDPRRPDYVGHGGEVVPQGLRIPFIVYFSPLFRERYPELVTKVKSARERVLMIDLLPQSLCDLLGIEGDFSDERLSFFSSGYDESRQAPVIGNDMVGRYVAIEAGDN